ncbi:MAG: helix-turn-helix domain-containing protein [Sphingobium sp.]
MQHHYPDRDPDGFVGVRYWPPPAHLRSYFGSVYLFTANRPTYHDATRADIPQLRFMLSATGYYQFYDGRTATTPEICMVGATTGATDFYLTGPTRVFGISLMPLGWAALGCDDACDRGDMIYDVEAIHGTQFRVMLDTLSGEVDPDAAAAKIWAFLDTQLRPVPAEVRNIVAVISAWLEHSSSPQIEDLTTASNLSARQIARYAKRLYGAPPKLLARKYRALKCAGQIVLDKKGWQDLCDEGTFYDQPHFIREIKRFIGLTPHQLMHNPTEVVQQTVKRRALTGLVDELNRIS